MTEPSPQLYLRQTAYFLCCGSCRVLTVHTKKTPPFVKGGANHTGETHVDAQSTFFIIGSPAQFFSPRSLYFSTCFVRAWCACTIA